MRKNVKNSDDKGGAADRSAGQGPIGGPLPGGPVDETTKKNKKNKVGLRWKPSSFFNQELPEREAKEDIQAVPDMATMCSIINYILRVAGDTMATAIPAFLRLVYDGC